VKGLYDRGFSKPQIIHLFWVIDWVLRLPKVERRRFAEEIDAFEKERHMPVISPTEQMWQEDGLAKGIAQGMHAGIEALLDVRFGAEGLVLMPRVRQITDSSVLEQILTACRKASGLDAIRALIPPQA
jgi:hypothetical protein